MFITDVCMRICEYVIFSSMIYVCEYGIYVYVSMGYAYQS